MAEFVVMLAVVLGFAVFMAVLAGLGRRVRRRGRAGGQAFVGPLEEIWHPGRVRS